MAFISICVLAWNGKVKLFRWPCLSPLNLTEKVPKFVRLALPLFFVCFFAGEVALVVLFLGCVVWDFVCCAVSMFSSGSVLWCVMFLQLGWLFQAVLFAVAALHGLGELFLCRVGFSSLFLCVSGPFLQHGL